MESSQDRPYKRQLSMENGITHLFLKSPMSVRQSMSLLSLIAWLLYVVS
jgi:hypothetical protein